MNQPLSPHYGRDLAREVSRVDQFVVAVKNLPDAPSPRRCEVMKYDLLGERVGELHHVPTNEHGDRIDQATMGSKAEDAARGVLPTDFRDQLIPAGFRPVKRMRSEQHLTGRFPSNSLPRSSCWLASSWMTSSSVARKTSASDSVLDCLY